MASRTLQQQVRAREMEYERQQAQKLKETKEKKRQKLVDRLNELRREEQERKIAALAEECALALHCIGQSHAAAAIFVQKQEAFRTERLRQAELNQQRESSRFKVALQKERVRRKLESNPIMVAKRRKKVKDFAAQWERSLGRFSSHKAKFKLLSRRFSSGAPPCGWFAEHKEEMSLLQPSDYKHTFLHSHLFIKTDDGDFPSKDNEMNAWKAAELQRQLMNSYRTMQMEIRTVMNKRKILRGQLAGSKLMIEKTLQLLEHDNLAIEKMEKETRRSSSHKQSANTMSKAQPQGVGEQLLESPKSLKASRSDLSCKASERFDKEGEHEVPQGVSIISCGNEQTLHISAFGESDQNLTKNCQEVQTMGQSSTSILCCEDIKICLDSNGGDACTAATERACNKKSRKLLRRALPCKSDEKADRGETQHCPAKSGLPTNVNRPCRKYSGSEGIKICSAGSEGKTKENKRVVLSQSGAKMKWTKQGAGMKSILLTNDGTTLHESPKKSELQSRTAQKRVKAVKFK